MSGELVGLIVFDSHYLAFQSESILRRVQIDFPFRMVTAPRHLAINCEYALEVPSDKLGMIRATLEAAGLTQGLSYYTI
ncbi:MAG: hypothetical protein DDT35_00029 [Firmicutes bacterium]|nr:hypothetical protein [Bacillota bacterium]